MFRPRCASLRQLLRQSRILSPSRLRLCFAPVTTRPLKPLSSRIFLPLVSSRGFSATLKYASPKPLDHFPLDLYDGIAEGTLDGILESLEILAEKRPDIDVEYSAGVLTLITPKGTYVINKQPPNRQLWLSSPISGPKRYDWDHGKMYWVDARDGSTLSGLLRSEVGIDYYISIPLGE